MIDVEPDDIAVCIKIDDKPLGYFSAPGTFIN